MKDEKILDNLKHIIEPGEAKELIDNDISIPIPKRIRDMVQTAKAKQRVLDEKNSDGILDKLVDIIAPSESIGAVAFGLDGPDDNQDKDEDDPITNEFLDDKE